jgi:hypothetical protein
MIGLIGLIEKGVSSKFPFLHVDIFPAIGYIRIFPDIFTQASCVSLPVIESYLDKFTQTVTFEPLKPGMRLTKL